MRVGRTATGLAALMLAATLLAELVAVPLSVGLEPAYDTWLYAGYSLAQAVAGAAIARRHPRNAVGWLLLGAALANAVLADLAQGYGLRAAERGWPYGPAAELSDEVSWLLGAVSIVLILLLFPNGRLPGPRWRKVPWLGGLGVLLALPAESMRPALGSGFVAGRNPYAVASPLVEVGYWGGLGLVVAALLASAVALVLRLRRSTGTERLQLKWFAYASSVGAIVLVAGAALWDLTPVVHVTSALALTAMPVAAGVAILRHRLYDIDVVINRTLVYGSLSVVLAAAYAAVAILLGTSLGRGSAWVTAGATLAVALAFRPLRARIQDEVDRRFDRARYAARHRVDAFLERLRSGAAEPEEFEAVLRQALDCPGLALVLREGQPPAELRNAPKDPVRRALAAELLDRGALAAEMARLRVELRRQLVAVEESRVRIVDAGDLERRRIERDLHDGAQQRLVSIGLALRHAQHLLATGAGELAGATLEETIREIGGTITELRELTHGLPPAQLDAGLAPAFHELARRSPVRVEVVAPHERFDRGLEAAAYFIGCEGLTNAVKHAGARRIDLSAVRLNGSLVVTVGDDGAGGADPVAGSGLRGLADRVAALGGTLTLDSRPGAGTVLTAELPCGS